MFLANIFFALVLVFIYLFGGLCCFQHCTGHITMGSWKGRGNQSIQFIRVLYCKLPTNGKQLPAFPLEAMPEIERQPQRWEARVLRPCHRGPFTGSSTSEPVILEIKCCKTSHYIHHMTKVHTSLNTQLIGTLINREYFYAVEAPQKSPKNSSYTSSFKTKRRCIRHCYW